MSSELKGRDVTPAYPPLPGKRCPTCGENFDELSDPGFQNHVEFCRIIVGVPDARVDR